MTVEHVRRTLRNRIARRVPRSDARRARGRRVDNVRAAVSRRRPANR